MKRASRRTWRLVAGGLAAALLAAGCGSGADSDDESASNSSSSADFSLPEGVPTLEEMYEGTEHEPPSESPPPAEGQMWWISCGMQVEGCSIPANAAKEAAAELGVEFHIADGRLNEGGGFQNAVRQAIAAGADGMIIQGSVGCLASLQALKEARAAGIAILGIDSLDCSDEPINQEGVYSHQMLYSESAPTAVEYMRSQSAFGAAYLINKLKGEARVLNQAGGGDPNYENLGIGFKEMFSKCADCEIVSEVSYKPQDLVPEGPLTQKTRVALLQAPAEMNGVFMPYDTNIVPMGGAKAVEESGRDLVTVGGQGTPPTMELIRAGKWDAAIARSPEWSGWAAVDNMNRAMNGQDTVPQGLGIRLVDSEHNVSPDGKGYESPIDFKSFYKKAWAAAK